MKYYIMLLKRTLSKSMVKINIEQIPQLSVNEIYDTLKTNKYIEYSSLLMLFYRLNILYDDGIISIRDYSCIEDIITLKVIKYSDTKDVIIFLEKEVTSISKYNKNYFEIQHNMFDNAHLNLIIK